MNPPNVPHQPRRPRCRAGNDHFSILRTPRVQLLRATRFDQSCGLSFVVIVFPFDPPNVVWVDAANCRFQSTHPPYVPCRVRPFCARSPSVIKWLCSMTWREGGFAFAANWFRRRNPATLGVRWRAPIACSGVNGGLHQLHALDMSGSLRLGHHRNH